MSMSERSARELVKVLSPDELSITTGKQRMLSGHNMYNRRKFCLGGEISV